MRVVMLTDRFPPEIRSAAHLFHDLARELQRRGHSVWVITRVPSRYVADGKDINVFPGWGDVDGISTLRITGVPLPSFHPVARGLDQFTMAWRFWRSTPAWPKADILLVYSPPLPLAEVAAKYHQISATPFILNVQDLYPQTAIDLELLRNRVAIRIAESMERRAYSRATKIVVHSNGNKEFLVKRKGVREEEVQVIYNWTGLDGLPISPSSNRFRRELDLEGKFVVSYAGIMGYAQDLSPILQCADLMREEAVFLLAGEGALEHRWRQMAREKNLTNVVFLPLQPKERYLELLAASDVCLVPLTERLKTPVVPGKLQSIMAYGRPVVGIAALEGDMPKMIEESGAGLSVKPSDPGKLSEVLRYLRMSPAVRLEMGRQGRAFAESHFSLKAAADAYETLFQEILFQRSASNFSYC